MSPKKKRKNKKKGPDYFVVSRTLAASYVFIVPLLALHEAGLIFHKGAANGTAVIYGELFARLNWVGAVALNLFLLALLCFAIYRTRSERQHLSGLYAWMFLESTLWAAALFVIAVLFQRIDLSIREYSRAFTMAIGAGLFEEFLFRFLLMGGLILVFHRGLGAPKNAIVPLAAVLAAVVFSLAHHEGVGLGTDPWDWGVFWLRTLLGALLGAIFWWRGFGIAVYTHALYNVALL
ncbi:MAG: CPBP family intramembrane glutamic endopeptidase [Planctomycetota bacterium]